MPPITPTMQRNHEVFSDYTKRFGHKGRQIKKSKPTETKKSEKPEHKGKVDVKA